VPIKAEIPVHIETDEHKLAKQRMVEKGLQQSL